jgi:FtsH-binding integral membrane protein
MEYANPYVVANAEASERTAFIRRTYIHLALAIAVFAGLEAFFLAQPWAGPLAQKMSSNWWLVLIPFIAVSWIADKWALSATSRGTQYLGLGLFIVAEAIIFIPLLYIAKSVDPDMIAKAGIMTGFLFAGITIIAFATKADFSFLRGFVMVASFAALGFIFVSMIFGFNLGTLFSGAMILVAGASILYSTSNILLHYRTDQHVAAALSLFSSVALMFWYILRIFMSRD